MNRGQRGSHHDTLARNTNFAGGPYLCNQSHKYTYQQPVEPMEPTTFAAENFFAAAHHLPVSPCHIDRCFSSCLLLRSHTKIGITNPKQRPLRFAQTPTWRPAVWPRRLAPRLERQGCMAVMARREEEDLRRISSSWTKRTQLITQMP